MNRQFRDDRLLFARDEARATLRDHASTTLTVADQEAFARAIDNVQPSEALIALMRGH
jgi:hypothetical protein